MGPAVLSGTGTQARALGREGVSEGGVLGAGQHPATVHRRPGAAGDPGYRLPGPAWFCQRVVVDQGHVVAGVPGGGGLRREVPVRAAGAKRIGREGHASMSTGGCRRAPIM